jgi:hypothetical protein
VLPEPVNSTDDPEFKVDTPDFIFNTPADGVAVPESVTKLSATAPVEAIEIEPAPLVMLIFVPAVRVASTGSAPVEPIGNCPLVALANCVMAAVPAPTNRP